MNLNVKEMIKKVQALKQDSAVLNSKIKSLEMERDKVLKSIKEHGFESVDSLREFLETEGKRIASTVSSLEEEVTTKLNQVEGVLNGTSTSTEEDSGSPGNGKRKVSLF